MTEQILSNTTHCTHFYHEVDGIHEFIFHDNTRKAADEYVILLAQLCDDLANGEYTPSRLNVLINASRIGILPVRYITERLREVGMVDPAIDARVAYTVRDPRDLAMLKSFNPADLRHNSRTTEYSFYIQDQRAGAINWLVQQSAATL